jgi:hypothetical protein
VAGEWLPTGTGRKPAPAKPRQKTQPSDEFLPLVMFLFGLIWSIAVVMWWRARRLVYRAREQSRWLLESWLERDGMSLIHCRMSTFPRVLWHVTVEDAHGQQFRGSATISGKFWSTPEFVPLAVHYLSFRRVGRKLKQAIVAEKISLWDEWIDRERME